MDRGRDLRRIAGGAIGFASAIFCSLALNALAQGPVIWLANGVLLAVLLRTPARLWTAIALACICVSVPVPWLFYSGHTEVLVSLALNVLVVMAGARLLARDQDWVAGRSDSMAAWGRFCLVALVMIPSGCTLLAVLMLQTVPLAEAPYWFLSDAVGTALTVPALLRVIPDYFHRQHASGRLAEIIALLTLQALICLWVSVFTATPVWLLSTVPVLIFVLFRDGFPGVLIGLWCLTITLLAATLTGHGPVLLRANRSVIEAVAIAHLYILFLLWIFITIAALMTERDKLNARAALNQDIYELIAMHTGDMLFVCDVRGAVAFVSPSMGEHFHRDISAFFERQWEQFLHPDDRILTRDALAALAAGRRSVTLVARFLPGNSDTYRDMEIIARLGPGRKSGDPPLVIGSMRDVTDRLAEARVLRARGDEMETLAATDALTGLPNRRRYDQMMAIEWGRAAREGQALSLLAIDADRFKLVNDHFGHETGDAVLKRIARVIAGEIHRPGDFAARIGGEEFAVLLPGTGPAGARILAERIREQMEEAGLPLQPNGSGRLTLSIGVATARPKPGLANNLFADADAALYAAKSAGRNRVMQSVEHASREGGDAANGPRWIEEGPSGRAIAS
ncbi:diguanylate cyclase [Segnochrobactraceae bacterium EtOH-i3]